MSDISLVKILAIFVFNDLVWPLLRLNLLVWVLLFLILCIVLGSATGSEYLFLLGTYSLVAVPMVLGVVAVILLPFETVDPKVILGKKHLIFI